MYTIVSMFIGGLWCYLIAKMNDRDRGWAVLWGALFGVFAIIFYYLWGPTLEKRVLNKLKKDASIFVESSNKKETKKNK